jgi:RNA polymerase sigma-70 factor (ECF subfamily)
MDLSGEGSVIESELIERARRGDGAAWERLVREYQEAVFRLAYLLLGDGAEADDVAQEAFIRAFRALGRFDTSRPLRPWLLKITANLARNRRRALGRSLAALRRLLQAAPLQEPSIERWAQQQHEARTLWQAVRRLNGADQEVIYLRYFLELTVEESAEALGVAPGTVKSRLHRALGRLRDVAEREFPGLGEGRADG